MSKQVLGALAVGLAAVVGIAAASQQDKLRKFFTNSKKKKKKKAQERAEGEELKTQPCKSPFYCGLTGELMTDPVVTPYNTCFERKNIEAWIQEHGTCPLTGKPLRLEDLATSRSLKLAIDQYREASAN